MSRTVAVTGITGFLGTALARRLVERGERVVGLVRRRSSPATRAWLERLGVRLVEGDVAHSPPSALARAFGGADLLVHSAAVIGYRRRLAGAMWRTNVVGTRAVARAALAAGVGRMVHVSSIAAIGASREPRLLDEDSPWSGDELDAAYFDTKRRAEEELAAVLARGLDATIVNPGAIYGPALVPGNSGRLVQQILAGRIRAVPPGGINAVPLETVVEGVLAAAERGRTGRRYVLGGENLHVGELVRRVGRAAGRELRPLVLPAVLGAPLRALLDLAEPLVPDCAWYTPDMCALFGRWMWFDLSRARDELGVTPTDLDACLAATVASLSRRR